MDRRRIPRPARALVAGLLLALAGACTGGGPDLEVGPARAGVPAGGSSLVVLDVTNHGDGADTLVGLGSEAAGDVEIHRTEITDGQAAMTEVDEVELPAGETVRFRPGALHAMLVLPDETVVEGGTFVLDLRFARSGERRVDVEVVPIADLVDDALPE